MNNTLPMPYTHSINFNIPNVNNSIPPYGQTPIHMTPIPQVPMVPVAMPFGNSLYAPYQPEIINKYNVNISTGNLGYINHIYQDLLPKNDSNHDRYATIMQRLTIANYYGLIFKKNYNQNEEFKKMIDIKISDTNLSYLLGHIKLDNINSYYTTKNTNPVIAIATAPRNFIMFNVCFPIVYDNNNITCAENKTRAQMRIYRLFDIDSTYDTELNKVAFELLYYNKIQEFIKIHKYPNFVLLYDHIVAPCKMDFDNIDKMKQIKNLYHHSIKTETKCLLMITESVNYNIIEWASKIYDKSENNKIYVSTVISTGVRSVEAWKSVIFQLLVAMFVLHSYKIGFKNFSLQNNVFIKKIDITPPGIKYWKYIINGVKYYVPNHGFLVMIDSNFEDNNNIVINDEYKDQINKSGVKYDYDSEISNKNIKTNIKTIFEYFKSKETTGEITIPVDFKETIDNIIESVDLKDETDSGILQIINDNFTSYLYEKIGHMIPESELNDYKLDPKKNFKVGDLVFFKKYDNIYIISSYKGKVNNNIHKIFTNTKDHFEYDDDEVVQEDLKEINVTTDLITRFHYKSNKEIIETYNINDKK